MLLVAASMANLTSTINQQAKHKGWKSYEVPLAHQPYGSLQIQLNFTLLTVI
jgi:hypothetical protein